MNMEEPLTLQELSLKIENMEKIIKEIKLNDTLEEESKDKETETETGTESTEVGVKTEEVEKVEVEEKVSEPEETETKVEEPEVEDTEAEVVKVEEPKAEEAKDEGVSLAEAEKLFTTLLSEGRVTPAERGLLVPLLASDEIIELSDGKVTKTRTQLFEYLKKQPSKFSLSEDGKIPDIKTNGKKVEMSDVVQRSADKIAKALNLTEEEKLEMISEAAEIKRNK